MDSDRAAPGAQENHTVSRMQNPAACTCNGAPCSPTPATLGRRQFLQVAGLGYIATTLVGEVLFPMAGPFAEAASRSGYFIPKDKLLSEEWLRNLVERGVKEVFSGTAIERIGMPCGGIGTGQLYLCGDGTLGCWQIFNDAASNWVDVTMATYEHRGIAKPVDQGFAIAFDAQDGDRTVKTLNKDGFTDISFQGEYPIGIVRYSESGCPASIEMEAFSPFIPLNAADSALPATVFNITVENVSEKPLNASLIGWLQNSICSAYAQEYNADRRTEFRTEGDSSYCLHSAVETALTERPVHRPVIRFADFEGQDFGRWTTDGNAFGSGPNTTGESQITGYLDAGFASSANGGTGPQGSLSSPPFVIERNYISFLICGGNHPGRVSIQLEVDGKIVRTSLGRNTNAMEWRSWNVESWGGREARIRIVDQMSFAGGLIAIDQIEFADTPRAKNAPLAQAADFGTMALSCTKPSNANTERSNVLPKRLSAKEALEENAVYSDRDTRYGIQRSARVRLEPGEKHTFSYVLTWHFPNQVNGENFVVTPWDVSHGSVGQYYSQQFSDAGAVAQYVLQHHDRLSSETRKWRDAYYDSTLPFWLLDRLHSTISSLATGTCQWWKNGRFWAYEGVACCHGTCTHVWNYAQGHARLFPELARRVREKQDFLPTTQGGGFHPDTGMVGFRGNNEDATDGQCGTVLKAYREHLMSVDNAFLERNWPAIKLTMEYLITQDQNEDGIIENRQHNTYDIYYFGANSLIAGLYLAALRAAEEMAREMADEAFAHRLHTIFDSGVRMVEEKLWNGEYYAQDVDLEKHPKDQYKDGCLSDQVFGQAWAHQVGLGHILPKEHVVKALESIWNYNWAPDIGPYNETFKPFRWFISPGDAGLFTCTWPKSDHMKEGTKYAEEVWTGIEYQVAAHMIWEGKVTEGLAICRAIHDRYHPNRFNPYNEIECGDHYARAMASWGVHLALGGFEYHGPKGWLGFNPRLTPENYKALFTTAEGWVTLTQERSESEQHNTVALTHGALNLRRLTLGTVGVGKRTQVTLGETPLEFTADPQSETVVLRFPGGIRLATGDSLHIRIST